MEIRTKVNQSYTQLPSNWLKLDSVLVFRENQWSYLWKLNFSLVQQLFSKKLNNWQVFASISYCTISSFHRLVEGVIRSVNNLLEKFHQSFFLYLLTGSSKFVSVGIYMIAFALLIAPLPVVAASLYSDAVTCHPNSDMVESSGSSSSSTALNISRVSWRWLHAAKSVFVIHIWAVVVALLPYFIDKIPNLTSTTCSLSWIVLSIFTLHTFYNIFGSPYSSIHSSHNQEWAVLKSVMIAAAFTGLSLMSVVNFAAAEIGALLLVPFCLMAQPLNLDMENLNVKSVPRIACNMVLGLSLFPPFAFYVMKGLSEGFSSFDIGEFWTWAASLWLWNSATYLYVVLVHLPCWVLCIHVLLHPCWFSLKTFPLVLDLSFAPV